MRKHILMPDQEPTDEELEQLMHEVIEDVKQKSLLAEKNFNEQIAQEIKIAQEKFKKLL
jgi:hypothetical protein